MAFLRSALLIKCGTTSALLFGVLLSWSISAKAEYRIQAGDTLEIAVAGMPDWRQRVEVQLDGSISYPLLGTLVVAGLSPLEVRTKIQGILPKKVFRQSTPDGRERVVVLEADQITANVVEYRPIYVNGDVSKPGVQAYHPLMTVRQAVALCGGYEIMRFRMNNPFLESADFRSEYESLWADFAKEQVHIWRIRTELGEGDHLDQKVLQDIPLSSSTISQIKRLEAEQLKSRQEDYQREKEFIQRGIKQAEEHIGVLSESLKTQEEGIQADMQDFRRVADLFGKGAVAITRITEARRALLWSSTLKLQTTSQWMSQKKQREEVSRQLQRLDDQRRMDLLRELQDAGVRLSQTSARLQGVAEKLQYTALVRSQLVRGSGGKPQIAIIRKGENGREHLAAEEDFELQPGDVVEVALRAEQGVVLPPQ
jgi:polysaccharide export outer membrane protein